MRDSENPTARRSGLVVQETADETLVYDMETNKAHCLNGSAAFVWKSCDGSNSIADIVRRFEAEGPGKVDQNFVWLAIDQLNDSRLLEPGMPRYSGSTSRRSALKAIGLASAVALPVIASLVAPERAMASVSCGCASNADCATIPNCPSMTNCNASGVCAP
jgi:hypothetical protein